ncbi:uncharacterized protein Z519_08498 [Cladophialophora bantiana CBS 173.52]|uniref:Ams2/SPT21 N-terminal domain-containing protein n=1 Tax=Cladophialophora bantiana (strain ATCC 10958 / CBS 173.52 / CDC B-1940 / NIH 8579) TaxID=1442370 RepID=A0A0D2HIY4_CLAB1|nr:uncharacterized protein Z519_08498 [Cladophialophora bantiana CBS 173.52]KIW90715.1 hypothetical protein Z519_08498 [Cladophialophora bantiana CBS 173.52]
MATSPADGVSIRTIRLKVLYTFDSEQKDNHLARWPHPLEVQTAFIDDINLIGVIDLRICLEAVTTASPELTTLVDNDYTIYAYDYSEPDTPLVGQGMLSKALASQAQGTSTDGEAMVTGKISKNIMGLFSKNAQETLEVKLRFTPVNTFAQARYRSGSVSSQDGMRPQWNNGSSLHSLQRSASPIDTSGLETMQRMLSGETLQGSGSGSRPGTPMGTQHLNHPARQAGHPSRPSSRAGMRQSSEGRRESFQSGYYSGDEIGEEGPARKRAKTTKVELPTKSNFNIERQPESLRVVASTASSLRLHRPIAINPAAAVQANSQNEQSVRPPTPIPASKTAKPRGRPGRPRKNPPSGLAQGSQVTESSPTADGGPQPELLAVPIASPEDTRGQSVCSTPANIPSSPPVIPELRQPAITSPVLPPVIDSSGHDSGFMSGNLEDLFGDDHLLQFDDFIVDKQEDIDMDDADQGKRSATDQYPPVFEESNDVEESQTAHPSYNIMPPPLPVASKPLARAQSYTPAPAARVSMSSPRLAPAPVPRARQIMEEQREQQRKIAPAPLVPKSDPAPRMLHRAQTWAPESDVPMSDAPGGEEAKAKAASKKKVGKEQTKARLENAIANGVMPPFCDNCGAIETPAWRRAYVKVFDCPWDDVETSLNHGECCFKEPIDRNPDGTVKTFRGYKVDKRPGDEADDWEAITLCNPCGLWFHKQKCPRPASKWQKKDPKEKGKRKRNPPKPFGKTNGNSNTRSDAQSPPSDDSSPGDSATDAPDAEENDTEISQNGNAAADDGEPQLPPIPRSFRANSAGPGTRGLQARTRQQTGGRQVQSSPTRAHGSEDIPIEIDLTPKPVRRQLFPSPDKSHTPSDSGPPPTTTNTSLPAFVRRSPRLNKKRDVFAVSTAAVELDVNGKENVAPATTVVGDGLAELFEEAPADIQLPPTTPTPKRRSERILLKTPSKTPQRQFGAQLSPNADQLPHFRTPKARQDQHPALTALLGTVPKDVLQMTPFSRSIHEALTSDHALDLNLTEDDKAILRASGKKETPKKAISFDFPDLPSLKNSSPMSGDQLMNFAFSEMTTDQLTSDLIDPFTTTTMTSSPPTGFFGYLDTTEMDNGVSSMWESLVDANVAYHTGQSAYPDPEASTVAGTAVQGVRRSPRRQNAK